ncbi:hypothetical protein C4J81_05790 [Deltaproteobacteria bacterium Smac51]|nr:hypothetical protein C4J81_05790 [Deltaproteobacteria bacterium Smac51]
MTTFSHHAVSIHERQADGVKFQCGVKIKFPLTRRKPGIVFAPSPFWGSLVTETEQKQSLASGSLSGYNGSYG